MNIPARIDLSIRLDADQLAALQELAASQGVDVQALLDEAVSLLLATKTQSGPRPHVMSAYQQSHQRYASLYEKLAK